MTSPLKKIRRYRVTPFGFVVAEPRKGLTHTMDLHSERFSGRSSG